MRSLVQFGLALAFFAGPLRAQLPPPQNAISARQMRLVKFVLPEFPDFLRQSGVREGAVVAAISHDAEGRPDDVLVLESTDGRFTDAALEAIQEWRFEAPAKPPLPVEAVVPVVRFIFRAGNVSIVPLGTSGLGAERRPARADTPVEVPNFSHLDEEPRALEHELPAFPLELRGRVAGGSVLVKFFVDQEGRVRVPVAINATAPEFARAALAAVRRWRFEPPRLDGKPVIALETQLFQFGKAEPEGEPK